MRFWSVAFAAVFGMLLGRNRFLFTTPIHELGDSGANSIIVNQAKHFSLLVGNYSRLGFNHPGPGFIYLQAAGEWLFHDVLGLVPTPWNGQLIAVYAWNAAMLATVAVIVGRRLGSWPAAAAALLTVILLMLHHPPVITSTWMPMVYVPTFFALLVCSASVIAGASRELWLVALTCGLLIHGHVVFLLFATCLAGLAVAVTVMRHHGWGRFEPEPVPPRTWLLAGGIFLFFLVPIGLHTIVHWPGEFGKYLSYSTSQQAGSHALVPSLSYVYQYWWPPHEGWLVPLGIPFILAACAAAFLIRQPFVRAGMWLCVLVTVLLVGYAYRGVDRIEDPYMGYFYWAVPLFVISSLVAWLVVRWAPRVPTLVSIIGVAAVIALMPGFRTVAHDDQPEVPAALATLSRHAHGRPIVVEIAANDDIGLDLPGLANWARREGIRICLRDARWTFLTTEQFICTPEEIANGVSLTRRKIRVTDSPHPGELARVGHSAFTTY